MLRFHDSAKKHGIAERDVRHAVDNAMVIEELHNDTRLYLGPARNLVFLEVVTLLSDRRDEVVIHAMPMRTKYRNLLSGE